MNFYAQLLTILTTPPGNLVYHLVIAFSVAWAFQGALIAWRTQPSPQERRLLTGLGVLLGLRLLLFAGAIVNAQGWIASPVLLPALDRMVTIVGIIAIVWMWAYPEPARQVDAATVLVGMFAGVVFLLNLTWGASSQTTAYNQTGFDMGWEIFALGLLITGAFSLIVRRPNQWDIGLGMLALSMAGHVAHLLVPIPQSDLPGAVRLAQIAAYPLLLTLPQRFVSQRPRMLTRQWQEESRAHMTATIEDWFALQHDLPAEKQYRLLSRFLARLLEASVVSILLPTAEETWSIACTYNAEEDAFHQGGNLSRQEIPILHNALKRKRPLRLPASSTSVDLQTLGRTLRQPTGHLLAVPVTDTGHNLQWGVVLLSKEHSWSQEAQTLLVQIAQTLGILQHTRAQAAQSETLQARLQEAENQSTRLKKELQRLKDALEETQKARPQDSTPQADLEPLLEAQEAAQTLIAQLQDENRQLQAQLATLKGTPPSGNGQISQVEKELRAALSEVARLQQLLSESDRRALLAQKSEPVADEQRAALTNIAQELRQPMSSILGYTDLLLGESVGILGALQRKFLERIKASIERMGALIEDLIEVVTVGKPPESIANQRVALSKVVDKALATTSNLMREKNVALRLDLPQELPIVAANQDSLQQALIHLLQNATSATPAEGEVTFRIRLEQETPDDPGFVLLQISDQGGGIAPDDMPRVFSRLYRTENAPIPGLGDTGVGLAVAKSLVESIGGRIWVDSEENVGSTFSILLPLKETPQRAS